MSHPQKAIMENIGQLAQTWLKDRLAYNAARDEELRAMIKAEIDRRDKEEFWNSARHRECLFDQSNPDTQQS